MILSLVSPRLVELDINLNYEDEWGFYKKEKLLALLSSAPAMSISRPRSVGGMFPVLRSLSLSAVDFGQEKAFEGGIPRILHVFDFYNIQSLPKTPML